MARPLQAIGQRNLVEHEREIRKKRQKELQAIIAEKRAELDRYGRAHSERRGVAVRD